MKYIKKRYSRIDGVKTIAITADVACRDGWEKNFPRLLDKVWNEYHPELFIVPGDLAVNATKEEYHNILECLETIPSQLAAVPGDHDRPLKNFMAHFGATRKVIDVGRWRFIGCNTSNRMFLKKEALWIEKNIRQDSVIFSHVPPEADGWTFHSLWPKSSNHFLNCVRKHKKNIHSMYFGHIHGFSERSYEGIPMTVTGAVAESKVVRNNKYNEQGFYEMVLFDVATGKTKICKTD